MTTTSRFHRLARRLVLVLGLGAVACSNVSDPTSPPPVPEPPAATHAALQAQVDADLARLRALEVVDVGNLILRLPTAAPSCYGPCPASQWDDTVAAEVRRQAPRLERLADLAERALQDSEPAAGAVPSAGDLAALNGLAIVELGGLLAAQPATNPSCYNLPCPQDIQRAAEINDRRVRAVHLWANAATLERP